MATTERKKQQLRIATLCYRYAYLNAQRLAGRMRRPERIVWGMLQRTMEGDPEENRREHRRIKLTMNATLRATGKHSAAQVHDISGAGLFVVTTRALPLGTSVQVRLGDRQSEVEYLFAGKVVRHGAVHGRPGVGIQFEGVPLELRHGLKDEAPATALFG